MYYLALVNETKGTLTVNPNLVPIVDGCEQWEDEAEARSRFDAMGLQAEINNIGRNPDVPKGDKWVAYMGDKPYSKELPDA